MGRTKKTPMLQIADLYLYPIPSWHFFRLAELDRAGFVSLNH